MLFFDSHVHLGDKTLKSVDCENSDLVAYSIAQKNTIQNYRRVAERNGISKCLAFPFPFSEIKVSDHNRYMLKCYKKASDLIIPLFLPDTVQNVAQYIDTIAGIKEHFYLMKHGITSTPDLYDLLQQNNKVVLIHAHMNEWIEKVKYITSNHPKLKIILAHSMRSALFTGDNIIRNTKAVFDVTRNHDNLYFDTSSVRAPAVLKKLIKMIGEHNLLWATDYPYFDKEGENIYEIEKALIMNMGLTESSLNNIASTNFRRLFQGSTWIRPAVPHDGIQILDIIKEISDVEKHYLAIEKKMDVVRNNLKNGRNVFVLENVKGDILGFIRKSDRNNSGVLIEEIYIAPSYRKNGNGNLLLSSVCNLYDYAEMKTFSDNRSIVSLAERIGFKGCKSPKGTMINWKYVHV